MWQQLVVYAGIKAIDLIVNHIKKQDAKKGLQESKEQTMMAEARKRVLKYKQSKDMERLIAKAGKRGAKAGRALTRTDRSSMRSEAASIRSNERDPAEFKKQYPKS